ncbi:MAG: hypothetical protein IIB88_10760 [Chloroflexi bacterium]|nr:hypothetical protein [Chloroflexota bacterium]
MYEVPQQDQRPGCRDVWVIALAMFAVILPVMLAMMALLGGVVLAFVLLTVHPALALIPIAVIVLAVYAFARWDQKRDRPPGL